ncbi:MAG: SMP-30/gluconolactonase/LRE family protein [Planctomycetia bacterium]|nr:SMP-30/gluconolactonase/LRE family protein [Planctomycetia bacterium]
MLRLLALLAFAGFAVALTHSSAQPPKEPAGEYVNKGNRPDSARATLASFGLPTLEGKWYYIGPFDNTDRAGFDFAYPPEKKVDLKATHEGKGGRKVSWKEYTDFAPGKLLDLQKLFPKDRKNAVVYLSHSFESPKDFKFPISFGSDDTLSVFINGKRVYHAPHVRGAAPDQDLVIVDVKAGTNELLVKITQEAGEWKAYVNPELPAIIPATIRKRLDRDFPPKTEANLIQPAKGEELHYKLVTIPLPQDCVLEVGGLAFRPDGKLLACTRRGEVWLIHNPTVENPADVKMTKFATGLHEALGLYVENNNTVFVVQRPELTKLVDQDEDGKADEFITICDKWGVSGDYHEFAFGPARDKNGNFFVTLNVGFGGGHQAKAAWRGWCVKVTPDGKMEPFAYGLRSPNGVNFSPEGDLFYCDNQGEWVATNKMHHIQQGKFFGHQAGLRWVKDSPFAGKVPEKVASGMWYDGTRPSLVKWNDFTMTWTRPPLVYPDLSPPCIWFPYGRMGKSASEPIWDTTSGKFGPFAGQCFVGDQTNSIVMRVALEKVNGVYQGACFPFRSGLQCGVNRLSFASDGSLFAGQTNRGWGSSGGKPYGLQRLIYTGTVPLEIHHVTLTKDGFDLTFTKPLDPNSLGTKPVAVSSHTYVYFSNYGCPETDTRAEFVGDAKLSKDRKTLSVPVASLKKGRVYEFYVTGLKSQTGETVLHPEAYYTLNQLVK